MREQAKEDYKPENINCKRVCKFENTRFSYVLALEKKRMVVAKTLYPRFASYCEYRISSYYLFLFFCAQGTHRRIFLY